VYPAYHEENLMTAAEIQSRLAEMRARRDSPEYAELYVAWLRAMMEESADPVVKARFTDRIAEHEAAR
jgi:hypothetical protein